MNLTRRQFGQGVLAGIGLCVFAPEELFRRNPSLKSKSPWHFKADELTMDIDEYGRRLLNPAMKRLVRKIEEEALADFNFIKTL